VIRAAIIYAAGAFGTIEILDWLIQSLALELPGWIMPIVAILFVAGFPVALYLAWISDIEQKPVYTIIATALILTGGSLALFVTVDPLDQRMPRLAVMLPEQDQQQDDVAVWASNDLRDLLGEIDEIEVLGRTTVLMSSMAPVTADSRLSDFGATHRVRSGLVRNSGRLQYTVSLEDDAGQSIWSDTWNGKPLELFEFQKAAVEGISSALGVPDDAAGLRVIRLRPNPTGQLEAFESLSRGQARFWITGDVFCEQAMADFERAIELDPSMGRAYLHKGLCMGLRAWLPELPRDHPLWESAIVNMRRGAELDPSVTKEAYERIADFEAARNRWTASSLALDKAKSVDPDAFSFVLANSTGHCAAVVDRMSAAYVLDPLNPLNATLVSTGLLTCPGLVNRDEGLRWVEIARGTHSGGNIDRAIPALLEIGEIEKAKKIWHETMAMFNRDLIEGGVDMEALRKQHFAALQDAGMVAPFVDRVRELEKQGLYPPHLNSFALVSVGAVDAAYESIFRSIEDNRFNIHDFMQYGEGPRRVRDDPRYGEVLETIGLVDYWNKFGSPPQSSDG
jgi:TolB-like protein/tetratricopeptide (TPR) repeat protein